MLRLAPGSRIFMAVKPIDMRRSFDGLCATITEALGGDPLSGDVFLFRGKRADRIKAIAWEGGWTLSFLAGLTGAPPSKVHFLR